MRYTAIAVDYDGTIAQDGMVRPHVLKGLRRLKASGRALLLVTGRELEDLLGIFPAVSIFDRVVAENGALLYRPESGDCLALGDPPPTALVDALRACGIPLTVGHIILATTRPHETAVLECIADQGLEQQVIFNKGAVMVLPPGCNKASGLRSALSELSLSPRNVVAVGDGENDHALLELAEYSFATSNAVTMLKEKADRVTTGSDGDGVLEVVAELLESDLRVSPPRRRRRPVAIGKSEQGVDILLPSPSSSILVAGKPAHTKPLAWSLLEQLCRAGYQFCAFDTRGDYLRFAPAVVFGTRRSAPELEEIAAALGKPDLGTVVCLAALSPSERQDFSSKLLLHLREMRARTGRPHWLLLDNANDVVTANAQGPDGNVESTIFVSDAPAALTVGVLASVDAITACGENAAGILGELTAVTPGRGHIPHFGPVSKGEALVWFPGVNDAIHRVHLAPEAAPPMHPA